MEDHKNKRLIKQFKQAVQNRDAATVDALLSQYAFLREDINEPYFSFDAPAIVVAAPHRELVDVLLKHGADINAKSSWWAGGFGVLHQDNDEMAHYLITRGARVDAHAAAALGMLETLQAMVEADPTVINQRGPDGQGPLHFAKSKEIIDFLLDHGADIEMRDVDHGGTPAQWAVNDPEKCRYLIERGAKVDIFMALMLGDVELVRAALTADPDCLQAQVGEGEFTSDESDGGHIYTYQIGVAARPLTLAARLNQPEIIDLLVSHSTLEQKFLIACLRADAATVQAILADAPKIVHALSQEDRALITDAAWNHQVDAVRTMLEAGFDVDARPNAESSTALHRAVIRGDSDIVALLLAHGASVEIRNEFGGTPLGGCIWGSIHFRDPQGDYAAVAERLIQAGVELPESASGSEAVQNVLSKHGVPR
ncbi:ankyrin repeat domain-containing protein [Alicyclobacillus fodiniaquatilis]|uniref:Ankyrin repeat domain-containing protein n=1 Tax=Alicyclobacillus fodiniaquatilis TaxID=1661150 RepID=A0ABW4JFS4_9BACL